MMRIGMHVVCIVILILLSLRTQAQEQPTYFKEAASNFTLRVQGIDKASGELRIAVFNSEEKYTDNPVFAVIVPVETNIVEWKMESLPFGEYAIAVYHDKNTNGKLDTNLLGIPKEDYGFSNDARGRFGPASWKDAVFMINSQTSVHDILIK